MLIIKKTRVFFSLVKSPWKPSSDVNPSWRCPKAWSYPQFSTFWVGIFHESHPAGGIPHDDETPRTPISRTCPPSASLSVGWAWEVILHPWMEPRKSPRRRTVKRRPGTAMRELDRNKGQKWNLMGFSCMAYGIFMAFYGLKYDLTDNYGVVVGIIFQ